MMRERRGEANGDDGGGDGSNQWKIGKLRREKGIKAAWPRTYPWRYRRETLLEPVDKSRFIDSMLMLYKHRYDSRYVTRCDYS
jgi:hypothetical protein